jgi:hypothetical protein
MDGKTSHLAAERAEQLAFLLASCHRLMLDPQDGNVRQFAAVMMAQADVTPHDGDLPLAGALVKEARAHLDELAYRLEAPGYPPVCIGALAARLCQTLTALQFHLVAPGPESGVDAAAGRGLPGT